METGSETLLPVLDATPVCYLRASEGSVEIPVGPNLCFPRFASCEEDGIATYQRWIQQIADHGGNFLRLWLGHEFFDLEPVTCGEFCENRMQRLLCILEMARRPGIKAKITIEFFRFLENQSVAESFPGAPSFARPVLLRRNGGVAETINDYLTAESGRRHFLSKLDFLARHLSGHPGVHSLELWNEMDAVDSSYWRSWTEWILPEVRRRFPGVRTIQSLGSFDRTTKDKHYAWLANLDGNDILQVHRYIDEDPNTLAVCRGPVDVMAASAIRSVRSLNTERPVLLAESGMVEPGHAGPSRCYTKDLNGTILHDVLFAPFFAGAAGPGQIWHWDFYLDQNDLWHHFRIFQRAIAGLDFNTESFIPRFREDLAVRVYELRGRQTRLFWIRDATSDWRTELRNGDSPEIRRHDLHPFSDPSESEGFWEGMDPWDSNPEWKPLSTTESGVRLPHWRRSFLVRSRINGPSHSNPLKK
jgi:hypothetical protein